MHIHVSSILLVFGFATHAFSQARPGEAVRVDLSAAAPATPSLKYRLLPGRDELLPGNAAAGYYRSLALFIEQQFLLQEIKKGYWEDWMRRPLEDFPLKDAKEKVKAYEQIIREVEIAARRQRCDWELDGRPEGIGLLIPEVTGYRILAHVLAVKARTEIAERQFDKAIHTLQTGYSLGKHLGEGPTYIHILVGVAITAIMNRQVDELIQQPGAPNLYWALTALPSPYFKLDHALREENTAVQRTLPWLQKLEHGPMTEEQVKAAKGEMQRMLDRFDVRRPDDDEQTREALRAGTFSAAKKALLDQGMTKAQVEAMPKFQVVALHAVREYRLACEEVAKWNHVADGWRHPNYQLDAKRYQEATARLDLLFFRGLLNALGEGSLPQAPRVHDAISRVDRRIAALRCLEAIRAYAAAHGGKLPAKLEDVTEVPVPVDPVLQKPFEYKAAGNNRATLFAAGRPEEKDDKRSTLTYEVTLSQGK